MSHTFDTVISETVPTVASAPEELLLSQETTTLYSNDLTKTITYIADTINHRHQPSTGASPQELARNVAQVDLEKPISFEDSLTELNQLYLKDAVWFHDRRYAMHLNCPIVIPAIAAEAITATVNSSMDTWDQSSGATMIERRLIEWTAALVGWHTDADGIFTSGGTQSNLQAMLLARGRSLSRKAASDPASSSLPLPERLCGLRIYASTDSHFSIANAAEFIGLGRAAVVAIPTTDTRRLDIRALQEQLAADSQAGLTPMAIVATAGTTDFGAIDPLRDIAQLAQSYGAWFHVDAAYGGGLLASTTLAERLDGTECADSITIDFHKMWFQPVACSAILVRDRNDLEFIRHHSEYLNPRSVSDTESPNQVHKSLQTTRRFDALKLWLTLRTMGRQGIGDMVDAVVALAEAAGDLVQATKHFDLCAPVQLSTVVFRFKPAEISDDTAHLLTSRIRKRILSQGTANIASTTVDGVSYLKLTLLNPTMTLDDIAVILAIIADAGYAELSQLTSEK
ncbi:MAG: pyridoxal phosphate-dependent decarboxylase family protein [Propionibacteriaceae bacterium]